MKKVWSQRPWKSEGVCVCACVCFGEAVVETPTGAHAFIKSTVRG